MRRDRLPRTDEHPCCHYQPVILVVVHLSVVIPIHNEEPSILPLYDRLTAVMERLRKPYEIIFTDDASTDRSFDLLANLVETDHRLKVIRLRRNFGQTAALALSALACVPVIAGLMLGQKVRLRMTERRFSQLLLVTYILSGLTFLVRVV